MLRWMCVYTKSDKFRNKITREKVEAAFVSLCDRQDEKSETEMV